MILVTGGNGFLGKLLFERVKSENIEKNIFFTNKSKHFSIKNNIVNIDLSSKNHVKKLFLEKKFKKIIHLAVSRNPMSNPKIRSFDTLNLDISILVNLLNCNDKAKKILFLSSAAVYKNVLNKTNREDAVKSNVIINKIINFINEDYLMGKKLYKEFLFTQNKLVDKTIDPFFHKNDNLRFNGITKLISEKILKEYCHENKIELQILRPYRII